MTPFNDLLRIHRARRKLSRKGLARETGLRPITIRRYEEGRRRPGSYKAYMQLVLALKLTPEEAKDLLLAVLAPQEGRAHVLKLGNGTTMSVK
jgi:transcriptional regulator with XRE-family HTH domain